jgi:hypothetical protein
MGVKNKPMEILTSLPAEIVCVCISSLSTILCAIIAYRNEQNSKIAKQQREEDEKQRQRRVEESMLSLKLMSASCALAVGTAMAVKRGYANGELDAGMAAVKEAQQDYEDFLHRIAVEDMVHKG